MFSLSCSRFLLAALTVLPIGFAGAAPLLPGYLTDSSADVRDAAGNLKASGYATPDRLKFPYVSTYYVKPFVMADESVEIGYFVADWDSSRIRFLDDSPTFDVHLEYAKEGEPFRTLVNRGVRSGDGKFALGALPAGEYTLRIWSVDVRRGLESHRVVHEFRVVTPESRDVSKATYAMTEADLAKYGISNNGATEKPVKVGEPGWQALEDMGRTNLVALQRLIDEKVAEGVRRLKLLPGTYRLSAKGRIEMPDDFTLDLNGAVLKENGFVGATGQIVQFSSAKNAHLVNGTLEGDYYEHDYKNSPNDSEWPMGFNINGDSRYCTVSNVVIKDITGYGASNGLGRDRRGEAYFFAGIITGDWMAGSLDPKTGVVSADPLRFTSAPQAFRARSKNVKYLQVSKYLGYQSCATRSWNLTVCWYGAGGRFISGETAFQYRAMLIPEGAESLRVSAEVGSAEEAKKAGLWVVSFRMPWNCAVVDCTFDNCRAVGYAASAMKNFLFSGNLFTRCGQTLARCAFDAEDGWDQMQDVTFVGNRFKDNPQNHLLTCAGHNFVFDGNVGNLYLWGRTYSPCVRSNVCGQATFKCDGRIRSGYARFEGNQCGDMFVGDGPRGDWDYVISGLIFDGKLGSGQIRTGEAGRFVGCTFKNMKLQAGSLFRCTVENCTGEFIPPCRWQEVAVTNSTFKNLYKKSVYRNCLFMDTHFQNIGNGSDVLFDKCIFLGGDELGFSHGKAHWRDCTFEGWRLNFAYWQQPGCLTFDDCDITTCTDQSFLTLATYSVGNIGFRKCRVSGQQALAAFADRREQGSDVDKGFLWMSNCTYSAAAPYAVLVSGGAPSGSKKNLELTDCANNFSDGKAFFDKVKLPTRWTIGQQEVK